MRHSRASRPVLVLTALVLLGSVSRAQGSSTAERLIRQEHVRQAVEDALEIYRLPVDSGDVENDNLVTAVDMLAELGADAVPYLVSELEQTRPDTNFLSAYALGRIGTEEAELALRGAIADAEKQPGDWASVRKGWAGWALGLMGKTDAATLVNTGRHHSGHMPIHGGVTVLEAIALLTGEPSVEPLIRGLESFDDENDPRYSERVVVLEALGRAPYPDSFRLLAQVLEDSPPQMRRQAAYSIARFDTPEAVTALLGALDDRDIRVRRAAALALKDALPVGRLEVPLALLETEENPVIRGALYEVLARAGGASVTDALLAQWGKQDPQDRLQLVRVLPLLDRTKVLPTLVLAARDPDGLVYINAIGGLATLGTDPAIALLVESVGSPRWSLAQAATEQLARLGEPRGAEPIARRLLEIELVAVVTDPQQRLRVEKLVDALLVLRDTSRLDELRDAAARQKDGTLVLYLERRLEQFEALRANGNKTKRWIAALSSPNPDVRMLAYEMLGRAGGVLAGRALVTAFRRVEPEEGLAILQALGSVDSAESRQLIRRVLTAPEFDPYERYRLRDMAAWSARRIGGDAMYEALLAGVERRSGRDVRPLVYLAVLGGQRAAPVLRRYRVERMRYIKWSRGKELDLIDRILRDLAHDRPLHGVDVPPDELTF